MKKMIVVVLAVFVAFAGLSACSGPQESKDKKVELETFNDKISYVLGIDIGSSLRQTGTEINLDIMYKGIEDSLNERELLLGQEETESLKQEFSQKLQQDYEKKTKEAGEKNLAEGEAFLEDNKKKEGVVITESGLQYKVLVAGDGALPASTDKVKVHYRGTLIDGKEFDSSYSRGEPVTFQLDSVLPGWVFNVATLVHGEEAFLAAVFLFSVHFFNVHFRPDKFPQDIVMFTGAMPLEEFRHEHTVEYRRLVENGELEKYLVEAPSAPMTIFSKFLGATLIFIGLTLLVLVLNGFLGHNGV